MEIPAQLIISDYLLDPKTEDIIYGNKLKDGMVVLIENFCSRLYDGTPLASLSASGRVEILQIARWCRVDRLNIEKGVVRFIGVYADESKFSRCYHKDHSWIVKLASVSE